MIKAAPQAPQARALALQEAQQQPVKLSFHPLLRHASAEMMEMMLLAATVGKSCP